ncbi:hypothetical protein BDZ94DRAFT_1277965 [Collybia nuda]|uniref:Peptidase M24 domain-containing protein n=1 Tax=Collybia nuda TaxID=64659 RepID=A0A9P5XTL7_9AGAR|nr:hypothetical protein BDZ94DRAFT_1277965 [Collybia nuda]
MISHEKAALLNSKLPSLDSKLLYPPRNLIDSIWKDKRASSKAPIHVESYESTGMEATEKLRKLWEWIQQQPPTYTESTPKPSDLQVGTLITALPSVAYLLNLRGSDIPFRPFFHAYLFVGLESAIIFLDSSQVVGETLDYIKSLGVECQDYNEIWSFLRRKSWGEGKLLITPQMSYAISLMLSPHHYTLAPPFVEMMMSVKNDRELIGLRKAHIRDGASFVRFLAWLEIQLSEGNNISEDQAASRLTEFRRGGKHFIGLTYEPISATGPNAALPHYIPRIPTARVIERDTPYLK